MLDAPSFSSILNKPLRFGNSTQVFSSNFLLSEFGCIQGYEHDNERYWKILDDALYLLNGNGDITSVFFWKDRRYYFGSTVFFGTFVLTGHKHILVSCDKEVSVIDSLRLNLLCGQNPYLDIDVQFVDDGYPHTNIEQFFIETIFNVIKPKFWLELGSMVGGSILKVAKYANDSNFELDMVCIDPFTGDVNMWEWELELLQEKNWRFLSLKQAQPTIYERFLANCFISGLSDKILPIRCTSIVGIKVLHRLYIHGRLLSLPEVIYLDSAHEPQETLLELKLAWSILPSGGVLCGDDWSWDSVKNDVINFSKTVECCLVKTQSFLERGFYLDGNILRFNDQWLLCKV